MPTLPSGRFVIRIEPGLHLALREAAEEAGLSLNEHCARKLASPGVATPRPGAEVIARAIAHLDDELVGVAVFGSWVRREHGVESDVDLLVAVSPAVSIQRSLYRGWDDRPLDWNGHRVEVHFVHLPDPARRPSALWAEVALDGQVIFERGARLSSALRRVRGQIAEGRMVRREAGGQSYWVEAG